MTRMGFDWDRDWHLTFELKDLSHHQTELTLIHSGFGPEKSTACGQTHTVVRETMNREWEKIVKDKLPSVIES